MTLYLYGFTGPGVEAPPSDLLGVAGAAVRVLDLGPVQAVVSEVPPGDFDEATIQERVRDLDWVSEQGALHERVVTWFVDQGGILPARFLTVHSSEEALRRESGPRAGELASRLEELSGLREWDLKISYREERFRAGMGEVSDTVAEMDREIEASSPGRRYLLQRKRDRVAKEEASRAALELAREAWSEVDRRAARSRRLAPPSGLDRAVPVILNAAFLIPREEEEETAARVAEIRDRLGPMGLDVDFTGPWAPYRFLGDDEGDDEGDDRGEAAG